MFVILRDLNTTITVIQTNDRCFNPNPSKIVKRRKPQILVKLATTKSLSENFRFLCQIYPNLSLLGKLIEYPNHQIHFNAL